MDIETCFKFKVIRSKNWTTISFCREQKDGVVYESLTVYDGRALSLWDTAKKIEDFIKVVSASADTIEMTSKNNVFPKKISFGKLLVQALEAQM